MRHLIIALALVACASDSAPLGDDAGDTGFALVEEAPPLAVAADVPDSSYAVECEVVTCAAGSIVESGFADGMYGRIVRMTCVWPCVETDDPEVYAYVMHFFEADPEVGGCFSHDRREAWPNAVCEPGSHLLPSEGDTGDDSGLED